MEEETTSKEKINEKKAQFFFNSKLPVHITLSDGTWENGMIDYVGSDFILLKYFPGTVEKKKKLGEYIFFLEIKQIEEYLTKESMDEIEKSGGKE